LRGDLELPRFADRRDAALTLRRGQKHRPRPLRRDENFQQRSILIESDRLGFLPVIGELGDNVGALGASHRVSLDWRGRQSADPGGKN